MQLNAHHSNPTRPIRRGDRPFDDWLERQLHEMYDSIVQEPLPGDLARMVEDRGNPASGTGGQSTR